jgi:glycosyltransferase involved in cell wall biosynthesis
MRQAYEENGIPVEVFTHPLRDVYRAGPYQRAVEAFKKRIEEWNVELVYGNTFQTFYAIDAATQAGLPSVWNPRESEPWQTYFDHFGSSIAARALECFSRPYKVVFVAHATKNGCLPLNTHRNFTAIHNGLDRDRLAGKLDQWPREKARRELGIAEDEVMILLLGTVCERKGQIDLLEATKYLDAALTEKVRICIVGDRAGDYSARLHEAHRKLDERRRSRIQIVPETPDTGLYLNAADVFVCSSRVESFPRVILEAMACGLPVVTTPVHGIPEQVQENINAYFYQPGDAKGLARGLLPLLIDPDLRRKMSRNSRYIFQTIQDYPTMAAAYARVFREAWLSGGPR